MRFDEDNIGDELPIALSSNLIEDSHGVAVTLVVFIQ
jgi:hypothetical protein